MVRLLFLGDSISNGAGASRLENGFPWLVADATGATAANESTGGIRVAEATPIARAAALQHLPDVAVICYGANDQKPHGRIRPKPTPPQVFSDRLSYLCYRVATAAVGCRVIIVSPPDLPPHNILPYRDAAEDAATKLGVDFVDVTFGYDREWLADDGWHPDDRGHRFIATRLLAHPLLAVSQPFSWAPAS